MAGTSYKLNPLQSMQIVCTSMICGESQYYRPKNADINAFKQHLLFQEFYSEVESTEDHFTKIVSDALAYDFEGSLAFIAKLRNEYFMRLNSHYLITQAVHHPTRVEFNSKKPKVFRQAIEDACNIPTDWTTQYKLLKESGKPIPTIWKKAIAHQLQLMTAYHASKYVHGSKTQGKKDDVLANLVDLVRITHPKPTPVLTELMKYGKVAVSDSEQTWEKLRSAGSTWVEINNTIRLPHMALLRNLSNIVSEYSTLDAADATAKINELISQLIAGVKGGKQFPFRYYSAYKTLSGATIGNKSGRRYNKRPRADSEEDMEQPSDSMNATQHISNEQRDLYNTLKMLVLEGLNNCLLESLETIPELPGRVDCLTDNSGSARGAFVSEYGSVHVYEISNLSAILTAFRSTEGGSVWIFGDKLVEYKVDRTKSILEQLDAVNQIGNTVGGGTETGVWLFWEKAIRSKMRLDNVFIYSDMQAGTGKLYADSANSKKLQEYGANLNTNKSAYIDVLALVAKYRKEVYSKVNIFSVQVAGYDNTILPDILYRGAIMSGWTGKEAKLAYEMSQLWDAIESPEGKAVIPEFGTSVGISTSVGFSGDDASW